MPRNKSDFGEVAISPLSGQLDLRSPSGRLGIGDFRLVLNASMNEAGKRCRRPGWKKLMADSVNGFNNQDLHDQLVGDGDYTLAGLPTCVTPPNDCDCPSTTPSCVQIVDYTEDMFSDCVAGATSYAPDWNGVIQGTSTCRWGFSYSQKSLNGRELAVVLAVKACPPAVTVNRWVLTIMGRTEDGTQAIIVWQGERSGGVVGTYHRAVGCSSLTTMLDVENCHACAEPTVTIEPPDGAYVTAGTYVFLHAPAGATVYYTTDGGDPDDSSTLYEGPFVLPEGALMVKAKAYSTDCESDIAEATYTIAEDFLFQYLCQPGEDYAGVFFEFAPNGNTNDYKWRLRFGFDEVVDVKRLEIYETNAAGVWVTGQAWATDNPIYPTEMAGVPFSVYPLVIKDGVTDINTDYETTLVEDLPANLNNWVMYGQPFVPLTGFFNLIFTYVDGDGNEQKVYSLISNQCECQDEYAISDDYSYCYDGEGNDLSPVSRGILNIDFRRGAGVKTGAAKVGQGGDYWNPFAFPISIPENEGSAIANLLWADMTDSGALLSPTVDGGELADYQIWDAQLDTGHDDAMMQYTARSVANDLPTGVSILSLPRGRYDVYVYGHGASDSDILKVYLQTPFRIPPESLRPSQQTDADDGWISNNWAVGEQYVVFKNVSWMGSESTDMQILFPAQPEGSEQFFISGIQLVRID